MVKTNLMVPEENYSLQNVRVRKFGADPTGWPRMIRAVIKGKLKLAI